MAKFDALFEDEEDIFGGSPVSKYWDIHDQLSKDLIKDEFDKIVERLTAMEQLLAEVHEYEDLDKIVERYCLSKFSEIQEMKKNTYLDLAGKLIYRLND